MANLEATLTATPIQVSNGAKAVHLTVKEGSLFSYAVSATMPNKAVFHVCRDNVMNISEGFPVWVWNSNSYPIKITYSDAI